mgnify:FL=1
MFEKFFTENFRKSAFAPVNNELFEKVWRLLPSTLISFVPRRSLTGVEPNLLPSKRVSPQLVRLSSFMTILVMVGSASSRTIWKAFRGVPDRSKTVIGCAYSFSISASWSLSCAFSFFWSEMAADFTATRAIPAASTNTAATVAQVSHTSFFR